MTRVGWLADAHDPPGGAEYTEAEFQLCAPDVEIVLCPPGEVEPDLDVYVLHNHMTYSGADLNEACSGRVVRYHHDVRWQSEQAADVEIYCSPLQRGSMDGPCIPPYLPLDICREAGEASQGRSGAVCAGAWMNPGKSPHLAAEWAKDNGGITFIGQGPYAPEGSISVPYEQMPEALAQFETFVYLPTALEPFGRTVVEAWAAGCEIVTNRNVGARYWIEEEPEALEAAGENFWNVVLAG